MRKRDEVLLGSSCLNKALPDEPIFILRAIDPAATAAIDAWIERRIELKLNMRGDVKLDEASHLALQMTAWRWKRQNT